MLSNEFMYKQAYYWSNVSQNGLVGVEKILQKFFIYIYALKVSTACKFLSGVLFFVFVLNIYTVADNPAFWQADMGTTTCVGEVHIWNRISYGLYFHITPRTPGGGYISLSVQASHFSITLAPNDDLLFVFLFWIFPLLNTSLNPRLPKGGGYHHLTVCRQLHQNAKKSDPGI